MKKILVIVGSAPCTIADLRAVKGIDADYLAVGLDAADKWLGRYEYFASYEPFDIPRFFKRRRLLGGNMDIITYSHEPYYEDVVYVFRELTPPEPEKMGYSGSSALLAVKVGLRLGYRKIIVCGCPLDEGKYIKYQRGWLLCADMIRDTVRSMSGWTKELLGAPTAEWINGSDE
jgi:hypothetical protein